MDFIKVTGTLITFVAALTVLLSGVEEAVNASRVLKQCFLCGAFGKEDSGA